MTEQIHILCVDDEPKVLEGLVLNLRRYYRVSTAINGQKGLAIIDGDDPPGVVVSDMRMPEMDGAAFLSQVKQRSPDTVRLLLTGQADLDSAIAAVRTRDAAQATGDGSGGLSRRAALLATRSCGHAVADRLCHSSGCNH
jgi:DNA-binding NtrC family response regulator